MKKKKKYFYFPITRTEGKDRSWILSNELRFRYEGDVCSMIHWLLFEAEAIPLELLKTEWDLENKSNEVVLDDT